MSALLDVNVLVALFDPAHPNHENAHNWFGSNRKKRWATCAVTVAGCVRVLSNPAYPSVDVSPAEVILHLREMCAMSGHVFWQESVALTDESLFRPEFITGHNKVTDAYLLGMAVRRGGRLATFDQRIPLGAVVGAESKHPEVIR